MPKSETITIDISDMNSILNGIRQFTQFRNEFEIQCQLFVEELGRVGVNIATLKITELQAIFTGEMMSKTHFKMDKVPNGYSLMIINDSEHAAFVEFGTGWSGNAKPYNYPFPAGVDWEYVVGNQIVANMERGIYGWWYKADDGNVYFTEGMESRPFMTLTGIELFTKIESIARQVFSL